MKLQNNYRIEKDENNVILRLEEKRTRLNKDKLEVEYTYTDTWYYPNLKSALKGYLNKTIFDKNIDKVLKKIAEVEALILKIK